MSQLSPQSPLNMRGAVDLSGLARTPAAVPGEKDQAWIRDVTAETFSDVVQDSARYPVLFALWASWSSSSKELLDDLASLANQDQGRWMLARVDADANPQVAQVFQASSVPVVVAVLAGRPLPLFEGRPDLAQMRAVIDQVLEAAAANGITGVLAPTVADAESPAPSLPPLHQEAVDAIAVGDLVRARSAYEQAVKENPRDEEARGGLAQVALLERGRGLTDIQAIRAVAADQPRDLAAQFAVADLDLIGGHVDDAFARLIDLVKVLAGTDREQVRLRLVEYFDVVGGHDPRVASARRDLASALY